MKSGVLFMLIALAIAPVFALGMVGCAETCEPTAQGLYQCNCQRCHEVDGSSATASRMADKDIDLRTPLFQQHVSDRDLATIMLYGEGKMEGHPDLMKDQVDSLVVHIRRLGAEALSGLDTEASAE